MDAYPQSLFTARNSLLGYQKFPARDSTEIPLSVGKSGGNCPCRPRMMRESRIFPSKFPDSREFRAETGSHETASTASKSLILQEMSQAPLCPDFRRLATVVAGVGR